MRSTVRIRTESTRALPCDAAMNVDDRAIDPIYPIVLTSWGGSPSRAAWVSATLCLIIGVAGTGLYWEFCVVQELSCLGGRVGVGPLALTMAPIVWYIYKRRGSRGLELRIDREGFTIYGREVPWDAVMSVLWRQSSARGETEHIEVRVRSTEGYRAPREARVYVDHRRYGVQANVLIDAFETAAMPRRIYVLAVEPPKR
jgi:hypothetical protein